MLMRTYPYRTALLGAGGHLLALQQLLQAGCRVQGRQWLWRRRGAQSEGRRLCSPVLQRGRLLQLQLRLTVVRGLCRMQQGSCTFARQSDRLLLSCMPHLPSGTIS